jgi:hypothetical protein
MLRLSVEIQIGTQLVMVGVLFLLDDFSNTASTSADNEVTIHDTRNSHCRSQFQDIATYDVSSYVHHATFRPCFHCLRPKVQGLI